MEELAAAGVSRVVVPAFMLMKPNATDAIAAFAERVLVPAGAVSR